MANRAASPPANIGFTCTNFEEICIRLDKFASGSSLPSDVIDYVNPYMHEPQHLPEGFWFLINSKESINMENGFWKTKEEACEVFSNADIIGWRTTLEYYEYQVHQVRKTDYVMQVFSTTQKRLYDDNEKKETSSLCRVFLVPSQEMHHHVSSADVDTQTRNNMTQPPFLDASSRVGSSNSNKPEVSKYDVTVAQRTPAPEHREVNLVGMGSLSREEIVYLSRGDYLELKDLDNHNPASASSSSENSSAVSVSSDECFDAMRLEDLDDPLVFVEQNDASRRLNVPASKQSDEVVMVPATLGSLVSVEGSNSDSDEFVKTAGSVPVPASGSNDPKNKVNGRAGGDQRDEGPSSSRKPSTSSDSRMEASASGRKRAAFGGIRKIGKYLCFMLF